MPVSSKELVQGITLGGDISQYARDTGAPKEVINEMKQVQKDMDQERQDQNAGDVRSLASHLENLWWLARQEKEHVRFEMYQNVRQRQGYYDPDQLNAIRSQGGSEIYMMLTSEKCRAAEAWLRDILMPVFDFPFTLDPTPVPDLPEEFVQEIANTIVLEAGRAGHLGPDQNAQQNEVLAEVIGKRAQEMRGQVLEELRRVAKEKSINMKRVIEDQLVEGNWKDAFAQFIYNLVTFHSAFIKGPVVRVKETLKYQPGAQGEWTPVVEKAMIVEFEAPSPLDIYPSPGSTKIDEGYVFERKRFYRNELEECKGAPGFNDAAINLVLEQYRKGFEDLMVGDSERQQVENRRDSDLNIDERIEGVVFWGNIQGRLLAEWGVEGITDLNAEYAANVVKIGEFVIKAQLNPDPLHRRGICKASWEDIPGAFWGKGIPQLMRDTQAMVNASARSLANNMAISSGPQVEIDVDRLPPGEEIEAMYPWKIWQTRAPQAGGQYGPAVQFYQPSPMAEQLLRVYDYFARQADRQTGVPAYTGGDTTGTASGAAGTAAGLNMLMGSASRGIKLVVARIDDGIITPLIERMFDYNMLYNPDDSIKGDLKVVARGVMSLLQLEQEQNQRMNFLQMTANPIDMEIVGLEGRAKVLREVAKNLNMDDENVVPSDQQLAMKQQAQQEQQMQMMQQEAAMKQMELEADIEKTKSEALKHRSTAFLQSKVAGA